MAPLQEQKLLPHEHLWMLWWRSRSLRQQARWAERCLPVFLLCAMSSCMGAVVASSTPPATQKSLGKTALALPTPIVTAPVQVPTSVPSSSAIPQSVSSIMLIRRPMCLTINTNLWCDHFSPGHTITVPPAGFCTSFACIATFSEADEPGDGSIGPRRGWGLLSIRWGTRSLLQVCRMVEERSLPPAFERRGRGAMRLFRRVSQVLLLSLSALWEVWRGSPVRDTPSPLSLHHESCAGSATSLLVQERRHGSSDLLPLGDVGVVLAKAPS